MKTTIIGWIARDKNGDIYCYPQYKPYRSQRGLWWESADESDENAMILPQDNFPEIKWEDEPRKVKLTITIEEEKE